MKFVIYTAIYQGDKYLVGDQIPGYNHGKNNYQEIVTKLFDRYPIKITKTTFKYEDSYEFHCFKKGQYIYLCISETEFPKRQSYKMLDEIASVFENSYPNPDANAPATQYENFSMELRKIMKIYNDPSSDPLSAALDKADEVKGIMCDNIDQIMRNQEQLSVIDTKSMTLLHSSEEFNNNAGTLKNLLYAKRMKLMIAAGGIVGGIIVILFLIFVVF